MESRRKTKSRRHHDLVMQELFYYLIASTSIKVDMQRLILFTLIYQDSLLKKNKDSTSDNQFSMVMSKSPDLFSQELNFFHKTHPGLSDKQRATLALFHDVYSESKLIRLFKPEKNIQKYLLVNENVTDEIPQESKAFTISLNA